jgi:hypothetical protein
MLAPHWKILSPGAQNILAAPPATTNPRDGRLPEARVRAPAAEKTEFNDPDWTVSIKLGRDKNGGFWLLDMVRGRANPGDVDILLLNTATQDGQRVRIGLRRQGEEVRFATDSPLEEPVTSEPVSEAEIPC